MTFAEAVADRILEAQPGQLSKLAQVGGIPLGIVDAEEEERRKAEEARASSRRRNAILGTLAAGAGLAGLGYLGWKNRGAIKGWWDKQTGSGDPKPSTGDHIRKFTPSARTTLGIGAGLEAFQQGKNLFERRGGVGRARKLVDRMRGSLSSEAGKLSNKPAAPSGTFLGRLLGRSPSAAADIEQHMEGAYRPLWEAVGPTGAKGDVSHKRIRSNIAEELSNLFDPKHKGPNAFKPFVAAYRDEGVRSSAKKSMGATKDSLRTWRMPQHLAKQLRSDISVLSDTSQPKSLRMAASARLQHLSNSLGLPAADTPQSLRVMRQIADTLDAGVTSPSHLNVSRYPGAAIGRTLGPMIVGTGLPHAGAMLADLGK